MGKDAPEGSIWTRMYQLGPQHTHGIIRLMIINRG